MRENARTGERLIFLLNYSDGEQEVAVHRAVTDPITGERLEGPFVLALVDMHVLADDVRSSAA